MKSSKKSSKGVQVATKLKAGVKEVPELGKAIIFGTKGGSGLR